jgi:CRISPR-associated protein Cas5h
MKSLILPNNLILFQERRFEETTKCMEKLISFDLQANFGFLKKPDTNEPIYITYNMLHKPALLGIMGAITGLKGFKMILETGRKKKRIYIPEYYEVFKNIKVGIQPLKSENGNYLKTVIRYNNSVGYASKEQGGNLLIDEQTLVKPSYRCFLLLEMENPMEAKLYYNIQNNEAEYLPYLGKNDFSIWWDNFKDDYEVKQSDFSEYYKVSSLIRKTEVLAKGIIKAMGRPAREQTKSQFTYFERLPVGYKIDLMQYELADFAYSNAVLDKEYKLKDLYQISKNECVHLF